MRYTTFDGPTPQVGLCDKGSMGELAKDAPPVPVSVAGTTKNAPGMQDEATGFGFSEEVHSSPSSNEPKRRGRWTQTSRCDGRECQHDLRS
jgi:hypothetical protein